VDGEDRTDTEAHQQRADIGQTAEK